ncbi:MAG: helix-turn-helix domain-containing protein [Oscillospiraceae bacterium]
MLDISEVLKNLRKERGYTIQTVANGVGIAVRTYQNYEYGQREVSAEVLYKLADFYGVTTDYLLGRSQDQQKAIDRLAEECQMSALEKKIVDGYLKLDPKMREDLMEFLHKSVREVMTEENFPEEESEASEQEQETITTYIAARSGDDHPPEVIETTTDFSKFPPTNLKL